MANVYYFTFIKLSIKYNISIIDLHNCSRTAYIVKKIHLNKLFFKKFYILMSKSQISNKTISVLIESNLVLELELSDIE